MRTVWLAVWIGWAGLVRAGDLAEGYLFRDTRTGLPVDVGPVTAETVEGFEILYATPGTGDIAEIAGHLLLRVRLRRDEPDPGRDVVLSFLADTTESEAGQPVPDVTLPDCRKRNWLNLVRTPGQETGPPMAALWESILGLTGGFAVIQDVQTLDYTLKTYTVEQDRTLKRYALNLTEEQKAGLVERLYRYPHEPLPGYFFFHQNCGSVVVRLVGEGIGDEDIAAFSPAMSPPHSLVSLLVRKGIAERVTPDFTSFRETARLYGEPFRESYAELEMLLEEEQFPEVERFFHPKVSVRGKALERLMTVSLAHPELDSQLYGLATLLQEVEVAFDPKDRLCRDVTGPVTARIRDWQQVMLSRTGVEEMTKGLPRLPDAPRFGSGQHTGLYPVQLLGGWRELETGESIGVGGFAVAGLRQRMGSRSELAMQRAGSVELFAAEMLWGEEVASVSLTGLHLRKFREALGQVEHRPWRSRSWGIGLQVLESEWRKDRKDWQGSLAGFSGLWMVAASPGLRNHLYVGAGAELGHRGSDWGLRFPLEVSGLASYGSTEFRLSGGYVYSDIVTEETLWNATARLSRVLSDTPAREWRAFAELRFEAEARAPASQVLLGVECLRF